MSTSQNQPKRNPQFDKSYLGKGSVLLEWHPCDILNEVYENLVKYRKANTTPELFEIQCQLKMAREKNEEYINMLESAISNKLEWTYTETSKHSIK
jgi:hypothetical protein